MTNATPTPLIALALEFDLPFALQVADGFGPQRQQGYQDFQFVAQGLPMTLRFARKVRTERAAVIDLHAPQDSATYTRVQVWFEGPALAERPGWTGYRTCARDLIDLALSAVNRYLMLYRELAGAHWLRAVVAADVPEFAFGGFYEGDGKDSYLVEQSGRDATVVLEPADEQALRERFASTYEPDPLQALAFTVRDLFERAEYWQAVAMAWVLFEARVLTDLRAWMQRRGVSAQEIARRLTGPDGRSISALQALRVELPDLADGEEVVAEDANALGSAYLAHLIEKLCIPTDMPHSLSAEQAEEVIVAVWATLQEVQERLRPPAGHLTSG